MNKLLFIIVLTIFSHTLFSQRSGINTNVPRATLHILPQNNDHPLILENLKRHQKEDSTLLVIEPSTGIVRYINLDTLRRLFTYNNQDIVDLFLNNSDSLFSRQPFIDSIVSIIYHRGDTLLYNSGFTDSLYDIISDSLILDTSVLRSIQDSIKLLTSLNLVNDSLQYYDENRMTNSIYLEDLDSTNEYIDSISLNIDTLIFYENQNIQKIKLPAGTVNTDNQTLNLNQDSVSISGGNSIYLEDLDSTNELINSISFKSDTLTITENNSIFKVKIASQTIDSIRITKGIGIDTLKLFASDSIYTTLIEDLDPNNERIDSVTLINDTLTIVEATVVLKLH